MTVYRVYSAFYSIGDRHDFPIGVILSILIEFLQLLRFRISDNISVKKKKRRRNFGLRIQRKELTTIRDYCLVLAKTKRL